MTNDHHPLSCLTHAERVELCTCIGAALDVIADHDVPDHLRRALVRAGAYALRGNGSQNGARRLCAALREMAAERRRFIMAKIGVAA